MPRMSKQRRLEWSFFLDRRNRISYNPLCHGCIHGGKPLIVTTNLSLDELQHPQDTSHALSMTGCWKCAPRSCSPGQTSADRPHKGSWID